MARYTDYIKALEADDGNPEGSGSIILSGLIVEGSGTDGNYGRVSIPVLEFESSGENESYGNMIFPALSLEAYSGTLGKIDLPMISASGYRTLFGTGSIYISNLHVLGDGQEALPPGGYIDIPPLGLEARGGPLIKIYQLCENENYGL